MIKQLQATRTCSSCGQKKPLVAFLELAGDKGHTYGDICSTCRGAGLGRKKPGEDTTGSSDGTRLQIDIKAKVQQEQDKKDLAKEQSEREYDEKLKKESSETEANSEEKQREEQERIYREDYLAHRNKNNAPAADKAEPGTAIKDKQITQAQGFYQEKARVAQETHQQKVDQQVGKKISGLTPDYLIKYAAASGRSVDSMFGRALGDLMRNHFKAHNKAAGAGQKTQQTPQAGQQPASSDPSKTHETDKSENQENTATEFVRNNNFGKR